MVNVNFGISTRVLTTLSCSHSESTRSGACPANSASQFQPCRLRLRLVFLMQQNLNCCYLMKMMMKSWKASTNPKLDLAVPLTSAAASFLSVHNAGVAGHAFVSFQKSRVHDSDRTSLRATPRRLSP